MCGALVSLTIAVGLAKGHAPAVTQAVVCSGSMVVTVWLDQDGQPVPAEIVCPDCLAKSIAEPFVPRMARLMSRDMPLRATSLRAREASLARSDAWHARAPPYMA